MNKSDALHASLSVVVLLSILAVGWAANKSAKHSAGRLDEIAGMARAAAAAQRDTLTTVAGGTEIRTVRNFDESFLEFYARHRADVLIVVKE